MPGSRRLSRRPSTAQLGVCLDLRVADPHGTVIANGRPGVPHETFGLDTHQGDMGSCTTPDGLTVGYARTPGYETYEGLGWFGAIVYDEGAHR